MSSQVTAWASSGGSLGAAGSMTVASSSKPVVVAGPNGHKAVRFDSASSQFLRTALFGSPLQLPLTQVLVVRSSATSTSSIISGDFSSNTSKYVGVRRNSSGYDAGAGASAEVVNGSSADTAGFHVVTARHGLNALLRVDTVESAGVTGQAAPTLANLPRITLAANSAISQQFYSGDIARLLLFSRALSKADIDSLHATLGATYTPTA